jgi:hypothetical protein
MVKIDCNEDGCNGNALYNYKNEKGYKYCKNHLKTRIINEKIQYMGNKSRKMCIDNLCSKNLSKESKSLCTFHYELKLRKLDNLIEINNIDDLNKLKIIYKNRIEELHKLVNVADIKINFTNNNITKFKLQGLKNITYIEELNEFKENKQEESNYLNTINIENLEELKEKWIEDYTKLTGKYKEIIIIDKNTASQNNPMCIVTGCETSANYNIKEAPAIYCATHAKNKEINTEGIGNLPNQIRNVRTKLCEYVFEDGLDCIKIATCGVGKKQFCPTHMEEGMYKLSKDKKCKGIGCNSTPSYGMENGVAEYCTIHKLENMIQLYQKCINEGCNKRARYNKTGETGSRYCLDHKSDEMLDNYKDKCIEYGCNENADYNIKSIKKGIYCNLHKKDNMCSNKVIICKEENCLVAAYFGTRNDPKQYCSSHKKDNMFNYQRQAEEYYEDLENNCLNKEKRVCDFLERNNIKFANNKKIKNSLDKFRPDCLIDCKTHYIIIEVDEDQHRYTSFYSDEKELERMNSFKINLTKQILFIRINPDYYLVNNKNHYTPLYIKMQVLLNIINKNKDKIIDNEIIYLYYDCSCTSICNNIH